MREAVRKNMFTSLKSGDNNIEPSHIQFSNDTTYWWYVSGEHYHNKECFGMVWANFRLESQFPQKQVGWHCNEWHHGKKLCRVIKLQDYKDIICVLGHWSWCKLEEDDYIRTRPQAKKEIDSLEDKAPVLWRSSLLLELGVQLYPSLLYPFFLIHIYFTNKIKRLQRRFLWGWRREQNSLGKLDENLKRKGACG